MPPALTPTPLFQWPEDIPPGDVPAALRYIDARFGPPDEILYRYSGFGSLMDYGADFSDRISFETHLVYRDLGVDFELRSNPQVRQNTPDSGVARLCLSYPPEEDPNLWYDTSLWYGDSSIPQKHLLFKDLTVSVGKPLRSLWEEFRMPLTCTAVPVVLSNDTLISSPATRLADFTTPPQDCEPPCWNSLTPGASSPSAIESFFGRLGVAPGDIDTHKGYLHLLSASSAYFEDFPHSFPWLPPLVEVLWSPTEVVSIQLRGLKPPLITPSHVLRAFGKPQEIVIWLQDPGAFTLILRYPESRTAVFISGSMTISADGTSELLCLNDDGGISTDTIFYAHPIDAYEELSLLENYAFTPQSVQEEVSYQWIPISRDHTGPISLEEAAEFLGQQDTCLPPLG